MSGPHFLELFIESVLISLTQSALNDVPICAGYDQNVFLQAPTSEKHYVACGSEFGLDNVGKHAIIVRALCASTHAGVDY